jgi:hypothetical protein
MMAGSRDGLLEGDYAIGACSTGFGSRKRMRAGHLEARVHSGRDDLFPDEKADTSPRLSLL